MCYDRTYHHANVMDGPDPSILDQIRDRRNVRIDVWRLSIIRVSGYKRSAEETLNDIDNELLSMNELDFDTLPFKSLLQGNNENLFSEEQIGIVARVTQSVISQFPDRNKVNNTLESKCFAKVNRSAFERSDVIT